MKNEINENKALSQTSVMVSADLKNGNSLILLKEIGRETIDLIVTDPPYKTTKRGNSGGTGGMLKEDNFIKGNGGFANNDIKFSEWLPLCYNVLKDGGHFYVMTNNKCLKEMLNELEKAKFKVFKTLIWAKDNCLTNMYYMDSHEYVIFAYKGRANKINNCGTRSVLNIQNVKNKKHPSEKPIELMNILIQNSSNENDLVLDPFMGVGSTGIASLNSNRNFIGFEIDESYFETATNRINGNSKEDFIENQISLFAVS